MANPLDSHLNFRMSSQDKKLIVTAAHVKGLKPNTYARNKLLEAAEKDLAEMNQSNTFILSSGQWENFMEIMEAPVKENRNLKKAIKSYRKSFE